MNDETMLGSFSLDCFSLKGKKAIITGGNNGVGLGYVYALFRAGASILVPCLDENNQKELIQEANACGAEIFFVKGDLCDRAFQDHVVETALDHFGTIDILINNAGAIVRKPLLECQDEDWSKVMAVNCDALYFLSRKVADVMVRQRSGKIINIASMISFRGGINNIAYAASKHAVVGITKNFANELGKYNIQVNAIAPGYIAAGNSEAIIHDERIYNDFLSRIPAGRWGTPADLQGLAVFLSGAGSDYINGAIIPVDGGYLCR